MRALRGAVIGCGFFAQNHLNAWGDIDDIELVAVCDPAKAEAAATRFGIRQVHTDAEALLASQTLDFVDIPTTMETHEEAALAPWPQQTSVPAAAQRACRPGFGYRAATTSSRRNARGVRPNEG